MTDEECNSDETGGIEKTGVTYGRRLEGCVITYGGQFVVHFTRQTFHCVNLLPCTLRDDKHDKQWVVFVLTFCFK